MLTNVLLAYSAYQPSVGYCQGMGFVTAMFLMYMPEEVLLFYIFYFCILKLITNFINNILFLIIFKDAFWLLDRLAGPTYGFAGIWKEQLILVKKVMHTSDKLMQSYAPKLVKKMV
jgi:hypothetical protein